MNQFGINIPDCSGTSAICPDDVFKASTVDCGAPPFGECDEQDKCSGSSSVCVEKFKENTFPCGGLPSGLCDAQNLCSGTSAVCVDKFEGSGVVCREPVGECDIAESKYFMAAQF